MIFLSLLKAEWIKTMRMRSTYIAFVAVALLVLIVELGLFYHGRHSPLARSFESFDLELSWLVNGYTATQVSMTVAFIILIVPMTIMTFARQISGEASGGTLRLILSRPISRFALMNAKFIVCAVYSVLLMGFFFVFSFGLGVGLFGWSESIAVSDRGDLSFARLAPEYQQMNTRGGDRPRRGRDERFFRPPRFDYKSSLAGQLVRNQVEAELRKMLISPWECARRLALAWLLTSWALFTLGALALIFSTLNRHAIAAMALTIGTFFLTFILQQLASLETLLIPLFTSIEPYLFTRAMGYWSACFGARIDWEEIWRGFSLLGGYTLGFFLVAQIIFYRRDVTG